MKLKIKDSLLKNFGIKMLALLLAMIIWVVIANVDDYVVTKTISNIPVEVINGDAITNQGKVYEINEGSTVDVVIKGKRSIVDYLSDEDVKAVADISKLSVTNAVQIVVSPVDERIDSDIAITCVDNMMLVAIYDTVDKQLPVTVITDGKPHLNYAVGTKTTTPNMVTVTGSSKTVSKLQEARVTISVDEATENVTAVLEPEFYDGNGEKVEDSSITCDVKNINVEVAILNTKEVPVNITTVGEVAKGYQLVSIDYQPTTLKLAGTASDLAKTESIDFNDVDISGLLADEEKAINIADYLPENVIVADGTEQVMVKFNVEKIVEKKISMEIGDVSISNADEKYSYQLEKIDDLDYVLKGISDNVEDVLIKDLSPVIDADGLGVGEHEVAVTLTMPIGVVTDNSYIVKVVVKKK